MARNYAKPLDLSTWSLADNVAFWANVDKTDGCWLWRDSGTEKTGYGVFLFAHAWRKAHRLAFALAGNALDTALVLDHKCSRRRCVNPAHLEQVTLSENSRRGKTQELCKRGHALAHSRLADGCKQCRAERRHTNPSTQAREWLRSRIRRDPNFTTSAAHAATEFAFNMSGYKFPSYCRVVV